MAEKNSNLNLKLRKYTFKAVKATLKGILFYLLYIVLWMMFLAPVATVLPGLQRMIETFVMVYVVLIIVSELTSGMIFQYFFDAVKCLFMIGYLIMALGGGTMNISMQNINLAIDLHVFLGIIMLLSLLGLAKSVLQAINFMSEKAEPPQPLPS
jgi:hypothetical protein